MIAQLKGTVSHKSPNNVIVDVGGVGYNVVIPLSTFDAIPSEGNPVSLHIYTHVREDQLSLFGFLSVEEKKIFEHLISVAGIGPKLAISVLSGLTPHEIVEAVVREDLARLNSIPGVGKRTSERIVVDLKDKFVKEHPDLLSRKTAAAPADRTLYDDAVSALVNLGYTRPEAEKTIAKVEMTGSETVQTVVKEALRRIKA